MCNACKKYSQGSSTQSLPLVWVQGLAKKRDVFLSAFGVVYVIVNFPKSKGKTLKEHILKDIVPCGFDVRIDKIQEKHRQAIEKKHTAIALLNDNLQNREYENVALHCDREINSITCVCGYVGTHHACDHVKNGTITICPCPDNCKFCQEEVHKCKYYDCRSQKNEGEYTVCGMCMEKLGCQAICEAWFCT